MNISNIEAFLAIVSTRSISKAADLLFLSQSTVSLQLKTLEDELGFKLIERQKGMRYVELTREGKGFISIAERFIQLNKDAKDIRLENKLSLTIGSVDSLNMYIFANLYQQIFFGENPMNLVILTQHSPEIYDQIDNHLIDVGLVPRKMYRQNIIVEPIFREKVFMVRMGEKQTAQKKYETVHPKNLIFENEVLFKSDHEFMQWHDSWCNPKSYPKVQVDTITLLLNFLKNDYWSILPASIIKVLERSYPIQVAVLEEGPPDKICYKITHKYPMHLQTGIIKAFEEKLSEYLEENSYSLQLTLL